MMHPGSHLPVIERARTAPCIAAGPKSWRGVGSAQEDWGELHTGATELARTREAGEEGLSTCLCVKSSLLGVGH
jgi:hypothetical protein